MEQSMNHAKSTPVLEEPVNMSFQPKSGQRSPLADNRLFSPTSAHQAMQNRMKDQQQAYDQMEMKKIQNDQEHKKFIVKQKIKDKHLKGQVVSHQMDAINGVNAKEKIAYDAVSHVLQQMPSSPPSQKRFSQASSPKMFMRSSPLDGQLNVGKKLKLNQIQQIARKEKELEGVMVAAKNQQMFEKQQMDKVEHQENVKNYIDKEIKRQHDYQKKYQHITSNIDNKQKNYKDKVLAKALRQERERQSKLGYNIMEYQEKTLQKYESQQNIKQAQLQDMVSGLDKQLAEKSNIREAKSRKQHQEYQQRVANQQALQDYEQQCKAEKFSRQQMYRQYLQKQMNEKQAAKGASKQLLTGALSPRIVSEIHTPNLFSPRSTARGNFNRSPLQGNGAQIMSKLASHQTLQQNNQLAPIQPSMNNNQSLPQV